MLEGDLNYSCTCQNRTEYQDCGTEQLEYNRKVHYKKWHQISLIEMEYKLFILLRVGLWANNVW